MPRQPGLKWQDPSEERGLRKRALHSAADFTLWGWLILKQYKLPDSHIGPFGPDASSDLDLP